MNMETRYYNSERSVQILLFLLKQRGIKRVIASPGTTNIPLVASFQHDSFFTVYSAPDERSAAYMACGLAAETGEAVVLTCTGATASRNYVSGLTEAYYRHLPVLAVTSTQPVSRVGNGIPQVIDRSSIQNDIAVYSTLVRVVNNKEEETSAELEVNKALNALTSAGGGPVHMNLETNYSMDFSIRSIPEARLIRKVTWADSVPDLPSGRIVVFVGAHRPWTESETNIVERFCEENDAVVFCDHTSNYPGSYRVQSALMASQTGFAVKHNITLLIHLGDISGDYPTMGFLGQVQEVWRVCPDGRAMDTFGRLSWVFELTEDAFFQRYVKGTNVVRDVFLQECRSAYEQIYNLIPHDLPFSNIWIAKVLAPRIPQGAAVHFGILNSLRAWNFFNLPEGVTEFCNVGGFGIDGILSTLLGASLACPEKLYFCILGDLAFFYDLNSLANRHVGPNLRILLINNGKGTEFRNYNHRAAIFKDDADAFIAAAGHYGKQSGNLIRHYAEDLGYRYLTASDKASFEENMPVFLNSVIDRPIIFEVFTQSEMESDALYQINNLLVAEGNGQSLKDRIKEQVKSTLGEKAVKIGKIVLGKE